MSPAEIARALRLGAPAFRRVPTHGVVAGLAATHAAWAAPASPRRAAAAAAVAGATGYPASLVDASLARLFSLLDGPALAGWLSTAGLREAHLDGEWGADGLLAFGPALTVVVSSGNIPGAALPSVVQALLLKSPVLAKPASGEPHLLSAYRDSLAEHAPELAPHLAVVPWAGGHAAVEAPVLAEAEALIAYGSDATLTALRSRLPVGARFLGYGHRWSCAAVAREALAAAGLASLAAAAARDVAEFDQQGCLSPQALYVERGGEVPPEEFAAALAEALAVLARGLPRRPLAAGEAAALHRFRAAAELRAAAGGGRLWSSPGDLAWTVVLDPDPAPGPCPLNRTAIVRPVDDLSLLPALLPPPAACLSVTLAAPPERRPDLAAALAAAGVTRLAPLGEAQAPADLLRHDGVNALAALVRFAACEA